MARVTTVNKARKDQGQCGKCGKHIGAGDPYRWWKFRFGGRRIRCMDATCKPKASDLTQSEILGNMYTIQEGVLLDGATPADLALQARDVAEQIRSDLVEVIQEKVDNMESGFGHATSASEELQERGDAFDGWADEIDTAADEAEALGEDEEEDPEDVLEQARDLIQEAIDNCPE